MKNIFFLYLNIYDSFKSKTCKLDRYDKYTAIHKYILHHFVVYY